MCVFYIPWLKGAGIRPRDHLEARMEALDQFEEKDHLGEHEQLDDDAQLDFAEVVSDDQPVTLDEVLAQGEEGPQTLTLVKLL